MKNVTEIKKRMDEIVVARYAPLPKEETDRKYKSRQKKLKIEYDFLNVCKLYLETEPTEEFIKKEKKRLENRLQLISEGYKHDERQTLKDQKKDRKDYDKLMGVSKIKSQLKAIYFLLSK